MMINDRIIRCFSELVEVYPQLRRFVSRMDPDELEREITAAEESLAKGVPVRPPDPVIGTVRDSVSERDWKRCLALLKEWIESERNDLLTRRELEYLALGMTWLTILILKAEKLGEALNS